VLLEPVRVLVGLRDNRVVCFDADTGEELREYVAGVSVGNAAEDYAHAETETRKAAQDYRHAAEAYARAETEARQIAEDYRRAAEDRARVEAEARKAIEDKLRTMEEELHRLRSQVSDSGKAP